jgi:Na+-transporting methylmalonyl-CoA/oxaloacetate decarboxylase gamma subunit
MGMSTFQTSLILMGRGMAAIFVVILIIYFVILALGKRGKK